MKPGILWDSLVTMMHFFFKCNHQTQVIISGSISNNVKLQLNKSYILNKVFYKPFIHISFHGVSCIPVCLCRMFYDEELEQSDKFYQKQPLILQLCYALYNMLVAHSEMVCYLVIIINHMVSASCVTLVLPITIFLWAMLSVPRPSKRYWMTAIIYTEVWSHKNEKKRSKNAVKIEN